MTHTTAANVPVVITASNNLFVSNKDAVIAQGISDANGNYTITFTTNGKYQFYNVLIRNTD